MKPMLKYWSGLTALGILLGALATGAFALNVSGHHPLRGYPPPERGDARTGPTRTDPPAPAKPPVVALEIQIGSQPPATIKIQLDPEKAPVSTRNFLDYVKKGFYNGTIFHRVIPDFMVQGGGHTRDLKEKKSGKPIKNEADNGLKNKRGTIAMARAPQPDSATSQFFLNVKDNDFLDREKAQDHVGYAVFGQVIEEGMKVVDQIAAVQTGSKTAPGGQKMDDVPLTPVVIKSASVQK